MGCGSSTAAGNSGNPQGGKARQIKVGESPTTATPGQFPPDRRKAYEKPEVEFSLLTPSEGHAPSARKMHTAVAVQDHSIIVFGGVSRNEKDTGDDLEASMNMKKVGINHQTFRVSVKPPRVANWHKIELSGEAPSARATHRAVNVQGSMYVFGSQTKKCNDVFVYNIAFQQWRKLRTTGQRPHPTSGGSFCKATHALVSFAGETDHGIGNDLHVLDVDTGVWVKVPPKGPLLAGAETEHQRREKLIPRRDHSALVTGDEMLVFGGFGVKSDELEFIRFNARTQEWSLVEQGGDVPKKRGAHSATMYGHYMVIFGGQRHGRFLNDLHVFNTETSLWTAVTILASPGAYIPSPRAFAACSSIGDNLYVHGGGDDKSIFSDFFRVNVRTIARCADPNLPLEGDREPVVASEAWKELNKCLNA